MKLPGFPQTVEELAELSPEHADKIINSEDAKRFEATIKKISKICSTEKICFVGAFGRVTEDESSVQCRTRMMGVKEDPRTVSLMWAGLNALERTRVQMQELAAKDKIDLNKYLGGAWLAWERTSEAAEE